MDYSVRKSAYLDIDLVKNQSNRSRKTSFKIQTKHFREVESEKAELIRQFRERNIYVSFNQGEIEQVCLNLYIRKRANIDFKAGRFTKYNHDGLGYTKVNMRPISLPKYNEYRMLCVKYRVSLSMLIDIAIRLYLKMAIRILFLHYVGPQMASNTKPLKSKWKIIIFESTYYQDEVTIAKALLRAYDQEQYWQYLKGFLQ